LRISIEFTHGGTMSIAYSIFNIVFKALGIDKRIAKKNMKEPIVKSDVEKMKKSMLKMEDIIKERKALQKERGQIK
jgi:hypothetical protein